MADYFDVDDILAEEELVPVVFNTDADGLGYLNPDSDEENLHAGARVHLPYWLAATLCAKNVATADNPKPFNDKTRQALDADAQCVNLRSKSSYFYEFGLKASRLAPEHAWITDTLRRSLCVRFAEILDSSSVRGGSDFNKATMSRPNLEFKLFQHGFQSSAQHRDWAAGKLKRVQTSSIISRGSKRRTMK